jgi:Flp pilus assembly protein TadD
VLELEPANTDAHHQLGQIALAAGRFAQANLEFELVQKLDPEFPAIRLALAESLLRRGMTDEARRTLREELDRWSASLDVDDPPVDSSDLTVREVEKLGDLLLEAGLAAEAAAAFDRVAGASSTDAHLLRRLALARYRAGDVEGGVVVSRRILRIDPRCLASLHNLALAALQAGRLRLASGWISRGLRVNRHDDGIRRLRMRLWAAWVKRLFAPD